MPSASWPKTPCSSHRIAPPSSQPPAHLPQQQGKSFCRRNVEQRGLSSYCNTVSPSQNRTCFVKAFGSSNQYWLVRRYVLKLVHQTVVPCFRQFRTLLRARRTTTFPFQATGCCQHPHAIPEKGGFVLMSSGGAVSMSLAPLTEVLLPMVVISMFRRNGAMIFRVNKHHIVNVVRPAFAERNHVMNLPAFGFLNAVSV